MVKIPFLSVNHPVSLMLSMGKRVHLGLLFPCIGMHQFDGNNPSVLIPCCLVYDSPPSRAESTASEEGEVQGED